MTPQSWWTFLIATFLISAAPGPNMLHMMNSGVKYGFRRTFPTMAGCFLAVTLLIGLSIAGIGAVMRASPLLFTALRYAGAVYLIWLGIMAWRTPVMATLDPGKPVNHAAKPAVIFRRGFLVGMSNPKALLFAGAFFPQFINPQAPEMPQLAFLFSSFTVMEIGWYMAYASGGARLAALLKHATLRRRFNRLTGALFGLFGAMLIVRSA